MSVFDESDNLAETGSSSVKEITVMAKDLEPQILPPAISLFAKAITRMLYVPRSFSEGTPYTCLFTSSYASQVDKNLSAASET